MLIFKMEKSINTVNMYLGTVHEKFIIHIWGDLMELYEEILKHYLTSQKCIISVDFPDLEQGAQDIINSATYRALSQIQNILKDDSLTDEACFYKIEEIVRVFERLGSGCGGRHDFG